MPKRTSVVTRKNKRVLKKAEKPQKPKKKPLLVKGQPGKKKLEMDATAFMMYEEISRSINEYTHDSAEPKFFLPEPLIDHCRTIAAAFAAELYDPPLEDKRIFESVPYSSYLLTTIFGAQLFLKERSIAKNRAPYHIETDPQKTLEAKKNALEHLKKKRKINASVEQVMDKLIDQLRNVEKKVELEDQIGQFEKKKFDLYLYATLMWGYFFAKGMIIDSVEEK